MKIEDFNIGDRVRVVRIDSSEDVRYKNGYEGVVESLFNGLVWVEFDDIIYECGEYGDACFPAELEIIHD